MLKFLKNLFNNNDDEFTMHLPDDESGEFTLKIKNIPVGVLSFKDGIWYYKYSSEFKKHADEYTPIIGFPNLNETYKSKSLWPFFLVRIPGLSQPEVKKIIKEENIDQENEVALLKRFGNKVISNPYELNFQ